MRFLVVDEDGPLRQFWTRAEAVAWMLPGMNLVVLPKKPKPDWFAILGEALL